MNKNISSFSIFLMILISLCFLRCEHIAKKKLNKLNINYTVENFLFAVYEGNLEVTKLFIDAGTDPNLIFLLSEQDNKINIKDTKIGNLLSQQDTSIQNKGVTALMIAALYDHNKIVDFLIKKGANINQQDTFNRTALILASKENSCQSVNSLLKAGANAEMTDNNNISAIIYSILFKHNETLDVFIQNNYLPKEWAKRKIAELTKSDPDDDFHSTLIFRVAVAEGDIILVSLLLYIGKDPDSVLIKGYPTPLMLAVIANKIEIVELLIDAGADINKTDNHGNTALSLAKKNKLYSDGIHLTVASNETVEFKQLFS